MLLLVRARYMVFILRAHAVRGELRIQLRADREVATTAVEVDPKQFCMIGAGIRANHFRW